MQLGSTGKLLVALTTIVCVTLLMVLDTIDGAAGMPIISGIALYIIGNGVASKRGDGVQSIIEPKPERIE